MFMFKGDPKRFLLCTLLGKLEAQCVISGNWSGSYTGGRDPRNWNGSVEILKEWQRSGFRPVRYGQCWVFAGTLNTGILDEVCLCWMDGQQWGAPRYCKALETDYQNAIARCTTSQLHALGRVT